MATRTTGMTKTEVDHDSATPIKIHQGTIPAGLLGRACPKLDLNRRTRHQFFSLNFFLFYFQILFLLL